MTREEFYKTIKVTPTNLEQSRDIHLGFKFEKYDSWELLLSSYCLWETIEKVIYGRVKLNPKVIGKDLVKLEVMQNEINEIVEEMYKCFIVELKKKEKKDAKI